MNPPADISTYSRKGLVLLLAVVAVVGAFYLKDLGKKLLAHTDECLTADRSQEMLMEGQFLSVPQNFKPNYNKPPLHYYLTAGSLLAFKDPEFAVRLPSCLLGLGCGLLAGLLVLHFHPSSVFLPAAAALLTLLSPLFVHSARQGHLDTGFAFFGLLGIYGFLLARKSSSFWILAAWAVGLGSLHKLPLALPWIGLALWFYRKEPPAGMPQNRDFQRAAFTALLLSLFWPLLQWIQFGPAYLNSFFIDQMGERILNPNHHLAKIDHGYYFGRLGAKWPLLGLLAVPLLLIGLFPRLSKETHSQRPCQFFSLWGGGYLLVLCLISGKSVRYLVPLVPVVAIVTILLLHQFFRRRESVVLALVAGLLGIGASRMTKEWNGPPNETPQLVPLSRELGKQWQPGEEVLLYNTRGIYTSLIAFYSKIPRTMHVKLTPETNFNGITSPTFLSLGYFKTMEEIQIKWNVQPIPLAQYGDLVLWRTITPPPSVLPEETSAGSSTP